MELALFVYLAGVIGNIQGFIVAVAIILAMALLFMIIHLHIEDELVQLKKIYIVIPLVLGLLASTIPSEKTMYLMLAGYTTQKVVQSETGDKVVKVINAKLDEYLEDMTKKESK